jgi:hypothetical protein
MTITYDAVALNREQRKTLTQAAPITRCRDLIHEHAKKEGYPPLLWATSYYGLIAMTEDGPSPLSPLIIRYYVRANLEDENAQPSAAR